jgi:uncharacterized membrane protein
MSTIEETIDVRVPVSTAYNQWTQFEEFPEFMEGVESVTQLDDSHLRWVAEVGGEKREWQAEIVDQEPDRKVAWRSVEGQETGGVVTFQPIDAGATRVMVEMTWQPEGLKEKAGAAVGLDSGRVKGDLERFKEFIESRGTETGAWRGEIDHGETRSL